MDLEQDRNQESNLPYILDKITIICITGVVITQLITTNGESVGTLWLYILYGIYCLVRPILAVLLRNDGVRKEIRKTFYS